MATAALGVLKELQVTVLAMPEFEQICAKFGPVSVHMEPAEAERLGVELQRAAQQMRAARQGAAA